MVGNLIDPQILVGRFRAAFRFLGLQLSKLYCPHLGKTRLDKLALRQTSHGTTSRNHLLSS